MSAENIREEINRGGRVVGYLYCVSVGIMTFKRGTDLRLIKAGHSTVGASWPYTLLTLVAGWWGIPWGPIYSIECLYKNLSGGIDVTDDVSRALAPAAPASGTVTPTKSSPPPLAGTPAKAPAGFNWRVAGLMAGGVSLLALFGVTAYCLYGQQHLTVVLANGLNRPYDILVNGEKHSLRAYSAEVLELPEGEFVVSDVPGQRIVGGEKKFRFELPFFDHLNEERVAVINPDRCAILLDVEVLYFANSVTPPADETPNVTLFANQQSLFLKRPDYVIAPAPQSIQMPSGTSRIVKHRLELAEVGNLGATISAISQRLGYDAAREHAQSLAAYRTDEEFLLAAARNLKAADLRALLERRLDEQPALVEWHRYYQQVMQSSFPKEDLVGRYRGYVQAHPEDGNLHYLLGRVVIESEQSAHWRAALSAKIPSPYAHAAIGYDALSDGRFAEALASYESAKQAGITSKAVHYSWEMACLALGRAADALPQIAAERKAAPLDIEAAVKELRFTYAATADAAAARKIRDAYLAFYKAKHPSPESLAEAEAYLDAELAEQTGDPAAAAKANARLKMPLYQLRAACNAGDWDAAAKLASSDFTRDVNSHLLLYIATHLKGDAVAAEQHFAHALAAMKESDADNRRIATLLEASPPDAAALCRLHIHIEEKRMLLTALGLRYASDRTRYFASARALNFVPEFPRRILARALAD